jgi:hypothetical protein
MIDQLSDQEKSVMLAKMVFKPIKRHKLPDGYYDVEAGDVLLLSSDYCTLANRSDNDLYRMFFPNLYDLASMALAWRVSIWAWKHFPTEPVIYHAGNKISIRAMFRIFWLTQMRPTEINAQRNRLDKILELAIEAQLVEIE